MTYLLLLIVLLFTITQALAEDCTSKLPATGDITLKDFRAAIKCLSDENAALRAAIPSHAVSAFNAKLCPPGWSPYSKAVGRVVVGLGVIYGNKEFSLEDTGGQAEVFLTLSQLPPHQHDTLVAVAERYAKWDIGEKKHSVWGHKDEANITGLTSKVGEGKSVPTMPPYVALLYCEKQ